MRPRGALRVLDLGPLLGKPTRQLSLGERMKCELQWRCSTARRSFSSTSHHRAGRLDAGHRPEFRCAPTTSASAPPCFDLALHGGRRALWPAGDGDRQGRLIYDGGSPNWSAGAADKRMLLRFSRAVSGTTSRPRTVIEHGDAEASSRCRRALCKPPSRAPSPRFRSPI